MQVSCSQWHTCDRAEPEDPLVGEPKGGVVDEISYCDGSAPRCNAEDRFDDASAGMRAEKGDET